MRNRGIHNLTGILALLAALVAIAVLFGLNTNSHSAPPAANAQLIFYFSLFVVAVSSFLLFYLALEKNRPGEGIMIPEEKPQENSASKENHSEKEQPSTLAENQVDIHNSAAALIPQSIPGKPGYPAEKFAAEALSKIASVFPMVQGLFFIRDAGTDHFRLAGDYAFYAEKKPTGFELGETLPGQVARNKELLNVQNIPEDYTTVLSGLGKATPKHLLFVPLVAEDECLGLIEISSFAPIEGHMEEVFRLASEELGKKLQQLQHQKQDKDL